MGPALKVVFANRFFHPDHSATSRMLSGIAFGLAAGGMKVHVVTSRQLYEDAAASLPASEAVDGVTVHRVWTTSFGRAGLLGRFADYLTFHLFATLKLLKMVAPGDVVIAMTDPPLISVCAALAAKLRRACLVNWQQDVFPEAATELGFRTIAGPLGWPIRAARNWSLRTAATSVAVGERMAVRLRRLSAAGAQRVQVIQNYADGSHIRAIDPAQSTLRTAWGLGNKFVVGYSGNMGRAHEFDTFIAACVRLKAEHDIAFVFIGSGQQRARLEDAVETHRLDNVRFKPYVADAQLTDSLGACDVHLVSLLPALEGLIVPSKFYGIAAAGRPTIYIGDPAGEIPGLLARHDIGTTVRPGDADGLATALLELKHKPERRREMGARARQAFEADWDRAVALEAWRKVIENAATAPRAVR